MFRLEFLLRQHTPLLHFQYDQAGATLRATELKSKLDRFIIAQETDCYSNEAKDRLDAMTSKHKDWLQRKGDTDKPALDYTVKVTLLEPNKTKIVKIVPKKDQPKPGDIESFPLYFGNMSKPGEEVKSPKHLVFHEFVGVLFHSTNSKLLEHIEANFSAFLLQTNFGTRQSKGFGSYYLVEQPKDFAKQAEGYYFFDVDVSKVQVNDERERALKEAGELFRVIELFYKTLRSGINEKGKPNFSQITVNGRDEVLVKRPTKFYFKSLLFKYLKEVHRQQWDKKTIKETFYNRHDYYRRNPDRDENVPSKLFGNVNYIYENGNKKQKQIHTADDSPVQFEGGDNTLLYRDLLGLSTEQSWKNYGKDTIKKSSKEFSRLASPIFFKPLKKDKDTYRVFFGVHQHIKDAFVGKRPEGERYKIPEAEILGKWFEITSKNNQNIPLKLHFPAKFNFDAFFKHAFSQNLTKHVEKKDKFQEHPDFLLLKNIYTTLNAQATKTNP